MALFPIDKLEKAKITSYRESEFTEAKDFTRITRPSKGHRWNLDFQTVWLDRLQQRQVMAFLHGLNGMVGTFEVELPDYSYPYNEKLKTNPQVDGNQPAGQSFVDIKGLTPNLFGIITAGDFVKFNGSNKVYMVTESANSDAFGSTRVHISPNLYAPVGDSKTVVFNGVRWTVELQKDTVEISRDSSKGRFVKYSIKCQEAKR